MHGAEHRYRGANEGRVGKRFLTHDELFDFFVPFFVMVVSDEKEFFMVL